MDLIILIGSIIGILNSFILIAYTFFSKKGNRNSNLIFAAFIFTLTLRISKSILLTFSDGLHDFLLTIGLSGFLAIGPVYMLFVDSIINPKFKFTGKQVLHLLPAIIFTFLWIFLDTIRNNHNIWMIFYRTILLQYMIYLVVAIWKTNTSHCERPAVLIQLNVISSFLLAIWFAYFLNEVAGFPYISGAVLYSVLIYFSIIIVLNKGFIINLSSKKYEKTGLKEDENLRIKKELDVLLQKEKVFKNNNISLAKIAKSLNASTHALSQVINENYHKTFFELIGQYRIEESRALLKNEPETKISDIAFDVGYNSLSAFNTAFKKVTGKTPSNYRNG